MVVREHESLFKYRDQMARVVKSIYPEVDYNDIIEGVEYSIEKRFRNFGVSINNNYTGKKIDLTLLEMIDYINKREPIITSYGVMFKKHDDVPNPMGKVIQNFLDLRKAHKKEMFKYPKNSEMFERYNLLQSLDKIDVNGIYGLIGLYVSILFDVNLASSVTSTGRSLISSAIMCFEGFLGNNVKFSNLNDILVFIDNVRMECNEWQFNDAEILGGYQNFITAEECFYKIIHNCGYKYIPSYEDMDIVYRIIMNCNPIELNRLFYKNNLYSFMDLDISRNLMIKMITGMKRPFIEPSSPPEEIKEDLSYFRDLLVEYVFYNHQYMDRMVRNKEMIKKVSVVSDTDSSFVTLDAWYNYNIAYLKYYDCPIMHQQIDLFQEMEKEKKDDYWKDKEIPEWYNVTGKTRGISFIERDEFGDFDPNDIRGIEFIEDKLDYDFFNQEIIELKRTIDGTKVIPQDNVKFALINIMAYVLSTVINLYMLNFTKQSDSYRADNLCKINMKNEFYMTRLLLTEAKKHYASCQMLQEGNYLGGILDVKGIDCLTKNVVSKSAQKQMRKILFDDILLANSIDQLRVIKDIAIFEKKMYNILLSGSKDYYKPVTVKSMDNYAEPTRIQGIKAAMAWNYIRGDLPGFDLNEKNSLDIVKVSVNKKSLEMIKDLYPVQYERLSHLIDPHCKFTIEGRIIGELFQGKLESIGLPKDQVVPEWLKFFIDYTTIISDNLSGFPVDSIGIGKFSAKKANYSNIVKL